MLSLIIIEVLDDQVFIRHLICTCKSPSHEMLYFREEAVLEMLGVLLTVS